MLEIEMVKECYSYIEVEERYKIVSCEVPFLSRCIDMVLVSPSNEITTIEFKLDKWRNAIQQALDHKQGTDYAYICLPKRKPTEKMLQALREAGVGLFLYDADGDEKILEYLPAPKSDTVVPLFREELYEMTCRVAQ